MNPWAAIFQNHGFQVPNTDGRTPPFVPQAQSPQPQDLGLLGNLILKHMLGQQAKRFQGNPKQTPPQDLFDYGQYAQNPNAPERAQMQGDRGLLGSYLRSKLYPSGPTPQQQVILGAPTYGWE